MPNLSAGTGGARLMIKRDDCTGLAMGGNKVRQLEFYVGEAMAQGCDTILITGAIQSNFVRAAAAAARKLGVDCHVQFEERVPLDDTLYRSSGNVLLDKLFGATLHHYPHVDDEIGADRQLHVIAEGLAAQGKKPCVIPLAPGHKPLGALGYVLAAQELLALLDAMSVEPDAIYIASGSGSSHGGLLFGLRALRSSMIVRGVCVRRTADEQKTRIAGRCDEIAALLGMEPCVSPDDVLVDDRCLEPGYGQINPAILDAMQTAAHQEGVILDPVYSGRAFAPFLEAARSARPGSTLVFLHTGGTPAIFGYGEAILASG
ncbi:MAG: pyridoxal-phosphate dependent enzyme [Rhodospirillaceae bacterium]|jgi:1-aminocyclopropane-1-carboxylate deaminase/D-cysteine desulfhydrase-like pyridoxal-dependent ACC family enzyme|nr:pyridoxal-phosphate dependent enzyme [Rhodospirillaceae bacterium]MBT7613829.1 pyridoxal-phosphate dependent enzyme [Rhodospirillaceae bacterium]MBT7648793.1 pyridoxal-phosphate dependent enzyme [Rhodospirillaceae bacterium]